MLKRTHFSELSISTFTTREFIILSRYLLIWQDDHLTAGAWAACDHPGIPPVGIPLSPQLPYA